MSKERNEMIGCESISKKLIIRTVVSSNTSKLVINMVEGEPILNIMLNGSRSVSDYLLSAH